MSQIWYNYLGRVDRGIVGSGGGYRGDVFVVSKNAVVQHAFEVNLFLYLVLCISTKKISLTRSMINNGYFLTRNIQSRDSPPFQAF